MSDDVPRRLPRTQGQRVQNVARTHAAQSLGGATAAARPVASATPTATVYRPEPWVQTFSYPGPLVVTAGKSRVYNSTARRLALTAVHAAVDTPSGGAAVILDVNVNGTTIFASPADRPTISAGANAVTVTPPPGALFGPGDYLTVDIDQIGSGTAGADLTVQVRAI